MQLKRQPDRQLTILGGHRRRSCAHGKKIEAAATERAFDVLILEIGDLLAFFVDEVRDPSLGHRERDGQYGEGWLEGVARRRKCGARRLDPATQKKKQKEKSKEPDRRFHGITRF